MAFNEKEVEYNEAFKRITKGINLKGITFEQLVFQLQDGKYIIPTNKQQSKFLGPQAEKRGIAPILKTRWGYRNVRTGHFVTSEGKEKIKPKPVGDPKEYKGYKVVYVNKILDGTYGGINYYAGQKLGYKRKIGKKTIHILKGQDLGYTKKTIEHEYNEAELMRKNPQYSYTKSHAIITRREKQINRLLLSEKAKAQNRDAKGRFSGGYKRA